MGVTPYTVEKLSTFCNNLIGCKTGFNVTWVVKRATSLFKSFCSNTAKQVARFCGPIYRAFTRVFCGFSVNR